MTDKRLCCGPGVNPDNWFQRPGTVTTMNAKSICMQCPLYMQCQEWALEEGIPYGVFGGLDERDREYIWNKADGRPKHFEKLIDQITTSGLTARRRFENWDRDHDDLEATS
jgi:hypothetical protein